jgi:hypothetical protein
VPPAPSRRHLGEQPDATDTPRRASTLGTDITGCITTGYAAAHSPPEGKSVKRHRWLIVSGLVALGLLAPSLGAWSAPAGASTRPTAGDVDARSATAGTSTQVAGVSRVVLTGAQRQRLRGLYAALRHIPLSDLAQRVTPDQAEGARVTGGAEWAAVTFRPAKGAPARVTDLFQDGAGTAVFTRPAAGRWTPVGLAGEPFACALRIAAPVRRLWHIHRCPATPASPPRHSRLPGLSASDTQQLADIAEDQVGVSDNPAETNFNGLDCNPYTAMVNSSAPTAGCGTNPAFGTQDASELWCSDFAKWAWERAGVTSDLGLLTPGSDSFYAWGQAQGESLPVDPTDPQVGDAVVFYPYGDTPSGTSYADHVGIITAVNPNSSINLVNGDFLGTSNGITNISVQADNDITNLQSWADGIWENGVAPHNGPEQWVFVSPQLPTADRVPAAATDKFGNIFSFWKNASNGDLEESYYSAASKSWNGAIEVDSGIGPLGSEPTVATGPQSSGGYAYQYVFWRGTNGDLYEAFWNGSWQGPNDLGYGPLGSAPTAGVDGSGNEYVFWESASPVPGDRGLQEAEWNGSSWGAQHPVNGGMGPLGSSPTVAVAANGDQYAFWEGTDGNLYEAFWNGSSWTGPTDRGDGTLGSPPTAGVDGSGNEYVFWQSGTGNLEETAWNGSSWGAAHAVNGGMGPLGSAPAVAVASNADQYVFWAGTGPKYDLWEADWNGSAWNGPTDLGDGPLK